MREGRRPCPQAGPVAWGARQTRFPRLQGCVGMGLQGHSGEAAQAVGTVPA